MAGIKKITKKNSSKKSVKSTSGVEKTTQKSVAKKATTKSTTKKVSKKSATKKSESKKSSTAVKDSVSEDSVPVSTGVNTGELDKVLEQLPADQKDKLEKIKNSVEAFKDKIIHRLEGYVMGVSLLPPSKAEDGSEDKESINVLVLIDDNDSKKMSKDELGEKIQGIGEELAKSVDVNLKPQTLLITQLWQQCYDSKYDMLQLIAMSAIVYDNGMLSAIKLAEIHKTMVLKKFEKYIVSYGLAGSLTQGRATPESDIDVFIVIDDTDVKKMTRVELRDKLRAIIIQMGGEASEMTGIRKPLNIQVYILTDFWDNIKDASPVIFTFLRDGVPFYDRGVFMPWKQLLQMGKIKPSPEAIDMYMGSGKQFIDRIEGKLKEIAIEDFYWALITPSQAALMMYGIPPTTPRETADVMQSVLVEKEKILEAKYVKVLRNVIKVHKDFEHNKRTSISGTEIDSMLNNAKDYLARLEKLFGQIQERKEQETVVNLYENIVTIIRDVLRLEGIDKVSEEDIEKSFQEHIIKKGYLAHRFERMLKDLLKAKEDYDNKKLTRQEVAVVSKSSRELTNVLIEHIQRKRGQELEKTRIKVKYGDVFGEIILLGDVAYIIKNLDDDENREVSKAKITKHGTLIDRTEITLEELEDALMAVKIPPKVFIKSALFEDLKNIFGGDVEVLMRY